MNCGGTTVIANGNDPRALERIFAGEKVGTAFLPARRMRGKRRWIAYAADVRGRVVVDAGAHRAITQGKASLLASGIVRVENHFAPMDVVSIVDSEGREFARGIANCASEDAEKSSERKSRPRGAGCGAFGRACDARQYRAIAEIMSQHRSQRRSTPERTRSRPLRTARARRRANSRSCRRSSATTCCSRPRKRSSKSASREFFEANAADCRAAEPAVASGKMSAAMFARLRVKESGVAQMATQIRDGRAHGRSAGPQARRDGTRQGPRSAPRIVPDWRDRRDFRIAAGCGAAAWRRWR